MRNPTLLKPWDAKLIWGDVIYTLDTRSRRIGGGTCFLLSSYREDFGPVSTSPPNSRDWCAGEQEIQGKDPNAVVRAKVWCGAVICSHQKEGEEAYWKVRRVRSVSSERKPGRQSTGKRFQRAGRTSRVRKKTKPGPKPAKLQVPGKSDETETRWLEKPRREAHSSTTWGPDKWKEGRWGCEDTN